MRLRTRPRSTTGAGAGCSRRMPAGPRSWRWWGCAAAHFSVRPCQQVQSEALFPDGPVPVRKTSSPSPRPLTSRLSGSRPRSSSAVAGKSVRRKSSRTWLPERHRIMTSAPSVGCVTGVGAFLDAEGPGQPADAGFQRNHHLRGRLHHQNLVAIEFVKRRRVGGDGLDRHDVEAAFLEDLGDDGRLLRAPGRGRRRAAERHEVRSRTGGRAVDANPTPAGPAEADDMYRKFKPPFFLARAISPDRWDVNRLSV